jgi:hypothetical protein
MTDDGHSLGASASAETGSQATPEAPAGLRPTGVDPARRLLSKVMDFHEGRKPYDFYRLPDYERDTESFDAWQVIAAEIRAHLKEHPPITTLRNQLLGSIAMATQEKSR